jgi:general secretion pathway protein J
MIAARYPPARAHRLSLQGSEKGLTLIELLVALFISALLGLMCWRALSSALTSQERVSAQYSRWKEIGRFVDLATNDWLQIATRPGAAQGDILMLPGEEGGGAIMSFIKLDGTAGQVLRVGYQWRDERIHRLRWPGPSERDQPRDDVVLSAVQGIQWLFYAAGGAAQPAWSAPSDQHVPVAVELKLNLSDVGEISRLVALR